MGLRLLALLSLVSIALAQSMTNMPMPEATPVPTPMPTTMATEAPTTMATEAPTTEVAEDRPLTQPAGNSPAELRDIANQNLSLPVRYEAATQTRDEHFFCAAQGEPFLTDTVNTANVRTANVWTIMLQYPILAYLDSVHKGFLMSEIVNILNLGGQSLTTENMCIGYVFHYDVSLYTESVLFQVYTRNVNPTPTPMELYQAFQTGRTAPGAPIAQFLNRDAIVINMNATGEVNQNVHPGAFRPDGQRFDASQDPTLRAVILGHWPRGYTLEEIMNTPALNGSVTANFAQNPNPVFYGLTGGDIVFIVIATFLCCVLAFLMVFGFCIHPFLM